MCLEQRFLFINPYLKKNHIGICGNSLYNHFIITINAAIKWNKRIKQQLYFKYTLGLFSSCFTVYAYNSFTQF